MNNESKLCKKTGCNELLTMQQQDERESEEIDEQMQLRRERQTGGERGELLLMGTDARQELDQKNQTNLRELNRQLNFADMGEISFRLWKLKEYRSIADQKN